MVQTIWECQAGKRYSNTLSDWRKLGKQPHQSVPQETWDSWQQSWNTPEYKKCLTASKNRLSEVTGPGNRPSRHIAGSRSTIDHNLEFVSNY